MSSNSNRASQPIQSAALRYAALGFSVFPCAPGGKNPIKPHGCKDATTEPAVVENWWRRRPNANIGLSTQGLLVVDVDGPDNPWPEDAQHKVDLENAPTSQTPRGGHHHVFRQPQGFDWKNTAGKLALRVDTRGNGGYILVPPSRGGNGTYTWITELNDGFDKLPEPPEWLIAQLEGRELLACSVEVTPAASPEMMPPPKQDPPPDGNPIPHGHRNTTLASLGGSMRRVGMSQREVHAALSRVNADRCKPPLASREVQTIAASICRYEPDQIAVATAENHWEQDRAVAADPLPEDPGAMPEELLRVPGFIDEAVDYMLATAPYPSPILAFASAITLQGFLAGRKIRDALNTRTNAYVLALANSGVGKEHPRKVIQRICIEAGLQHCLGETFASGEGIEDRLLANPSALFMNDEINILMHAINRATDARWEGIMGALLKFYTASNGVYPMRVKAGNRTSGVIDQPSLCLLGTAVPKYYYAAMSPQMLRDGFCARLLIVEAGSRGRGQTPVDKPMPHRLVEAARWWADFRPGGNANLQEWHPQPATVKTTPASEDRLSACREFCDDRYTEAEQRDDQVAMAIWARAVEKTRKLALIYAASGNRLLPSIDADAVEWSWRFVYHQTRRMLFMAGSHVAESLFDGKCKRMLEVLTSWDRRNPGEWAPHWEVSRRLGWSDRDIDEVRATLVGQLRIEFVSGSTQLGGRPGRRYRLAAVTSELPQLPQKMW